MRPSVTHLYKRVCPSVCPSVRPAVRPSVRPSVGPSVGPLRLCKNRVSRLFLATVRSYTETNDQPTCFASLFTRLFVHLSLHTYVTWSIHAETQPGRIVARSGLFLADSENHDVRIEIHYENALEDKNAPPWIQMKNNKIDSHIYEIVIINEKNSNTNDVLRFSLMNLEI